MCFTFTRYAFNTQARLARRPPDDTSTDTGVVLYTKTQYKDTIVQISSSATALAATNYLKIKFGNHSSYSSTIRNRHLIANAAAQSASTTTATAYELSTVYEDKIERHNTKMQYEDK